MRVLVTGAAGGVGQLLLPALAGEHDLRLTDLRAPERVGRAEVALGDLADPGFAERLCAGVDAIVHLAGNPRPGDDWDRLRGPNLQVPTGILAAAEQAGVRRVVLASSVHVLGGYHPPSARPAPGPIRDAWPPRPCCRYGATKVFGEAAARVYADSGAFSVVCLRLGGCRPVPPTRGWFDTWLGPADLGQAVRLALRADVRFGAYTVTSANTAALFDLGAARRDLGYAPGEDSETYRHSVPVGPSTMCRSGRD
ncbi:NAD-dependent epimerase/dehydratase family protein [Micromonospora sp. NPDC048830]|uniref:NAD-dependent epimerase/dehydratase family protein n=1 Tax=Micromonospora sp. NPDC048830 TaxID=3364257 RepID=UPI00371682EC